MFKIRSMKMNAEAEKEQLQAQNRVSDGMMFKIEWDPRVIGNVELPDGTRKTGIGEFIRKTSLDEFPQFFNVLNGFRINDLVIWIIQALFVCSLQANMTFREFRKFYVQLLVIEGIISLLAYTWGDILGNRLPFIHLEMRDNTGFYVAPYFTLGWINIPVFHRTA